MAISVYLDNNIWDFLFDRQLDLVVELPRDEFCLCLTREAEFEIPPMPPDKRAFAETTIGKCGVLIDTFFGFYDDSLPATEQRVGGFDVGRWATSEELAFLAQQRTPFSKTKNPKSRLYQNEADVSLAGRSFHSVVISLDAKHGPLKSAYKQGGMVVFLTDFDQSGLTLRDFIQRALGTSVTHAT